MFQLIVLQIHNNHPLIGLEYQQNFSRVGANFIFVVQFSFASILWCSCVGVWDQESSIMHVCINWWFRVQDFCIIMYICLIWVVLSYNTTHMKKSCEYSRYWVVCMIVVFTGGFSWSSLLDEHNYYFFLFTFFVNCCLTIACYGVGLSPGSLCPQVLIQGACLGMRLAIELNSIR